MSTTDGPNSGLPGFEHFYLNLFFKLGSAVTSDNAALASFQNSSRSILQIVDENDLGVLSQHLLIPRLQGIQHSSRNWSVLMVLDHLAMVNQSIMDVIRSLKSYTEPFDPVRIANFKPNPDADADAIERFRDVSQRYWAFAKSHHPLRTDLTCPHPWFGRLDGHRWHCLAAAHQKIHRRQIYKLLAMIGVT